MPLLEKYFDSFKENISIYLTPLTSFYKIKKDKLPPFLKFISAYFSVFLSVQKNKKINISMIVWPNDIFYWNKNTAFSF